MKKHTLQETYERMFGKINEAKPMKLQSKGGKIVVFKNKDNYEKAKKSGDYEDPTDGSDGDKKEKPSGKLGGGDFARDKGSVKVDSDYIVKDKGSFFIDREDIDTGDAIAEPGQVITFKYKGKTYSGTVDDKGQGRDDDTFKVNIE